MTCHLGHHNAWHRWCPYCPTFFDVALAATRARYARRHLMPR